MLPLPLGAYSLKSVLRGHTLATPVNGRLVPEDLARLYGLEALHADGQFGAGQKIAFIEFAAPDSSDDQAFWQHRSAAPGRNTPVASVRVDRAAGDSAALGETDLDVQYAGALAPAAQLTAYVISDRSGSGDFLGQMYDALSAAADDGHHIVSISLGTSERLFQESGEIRSPRSGRSWENAMAYAESFEELVRELRLLIFAAAGDSGAYGGLPFHDDRPQPIWPAIQPGVVAVGGTQLAVPGNVESGEVAWGGQTHDPGEAGYSDANTLPNASGGGGVGTAFAPPAYQSGLPFAGRATPDIAAFAGPLEIVYRQRTISIWGTSAAAPIAAAIAALTEGALGTRLEAAAFQGGGATADVVAGNNWNDHLLTLGLDTFYTAAPGFDLCTGHGTPHVARLLGRRP